MKEECHIVQISHIDAGNDAEKPQPKLSCLPVIVTRNLVLFPQVGIPISLVRSNARKVANYANRHHIPVAICCQLNESDEMVNEASQIYRYGVVADVLQIIDLPGGEQTALVRARDRIEVISTAQPETIPFAHLSIVAKPSPDIFSKAEDKEFDVLMQSIVSTYEQLTKTAEFPPAFVTINETEGNAPLRVNTIATHIPGDPQQKMDMLAIRRVKQRAFRLYKVLEQLKAEVEIAINIRERAHAELNQQNRRAFLQSQLNLIREELYGSDDEEIDLLRKRLTEAKLPEAAEKALNKELNRLQRTNPATPEYSTSLNYIETVLDLPWGNLTPINDDFSIAEQTLHNDHYGLEKVKERILEQLAVMLNNPQGRSPIICLVGPPGVGKTSLGQSIARALGRTYQRVALGGLHDEAEIRGHRRTYIGAMPGRIIEAIKRAGSVNPVILLDEVDKIGNDYKGDPSAALLEVLDPEQNCHFHDNYIDLDFDLSNTLFIATANTLATLSQPLIDRMEVIELQPYRKDEKIEIARRHLIPRLLERHNLDASAINISDEAISRIIDGYTHEKGVRQLEKTLASVIRKLILRKMRDLPLPDVVDSQQVTDFLGAPDNNSRLGFRI